MWPSHCQITRTRILALLLPLLLSACGFELRDAVVLPPQLSKLHVLAVENVVRLPERCICLRQAKGC